MNEKFIWLSDEDQSYCHEHGSQTITPSSSFDKNIGFTFKMDAGENTLTLDTDKKNSIKVNDIHWPRSPIEFKEGYEAVHKAENTDITLGKTINISSGNLIILGSEGKPVNFYLNSEIFNTYRIKLQNSSSFSIKNLNIVRISGPINTAIPTLEESTVAMSGKSRLTIETVEKIESIISLSCHFSITESSQTSLTSHHVNIIDGSNIILQNNAQMLISSQVLNIRTDLDEKGYPLFDTNFTLKAGATLLNLNSLDGIHFPLDIHREDYPKGVFNFIAEGEENTGKVVIDVAPKDANAYGLNIMLRKNFIAINGKVVETGDQMKYFDFSYGKDIRNGSKQVGTITISLRNPNLQLP
ncbi:hypothetical protein TI10_06530 [Photorhabdus luminescens subsp. luminescens]|uniref:Uncharacterized protein n=1 Tax=Photorhabdus luminescens TaxID=29488 RepID=A0A1G5PYN0_PHOLU|nr:hypothetical protein [Photorhabdus luminescens]KMW73878.1 hypothetical protein TI10_06530 [Photorhabdus luminescens subsp. luminescens]SCZ54301.1 hypothetical protein SAMN02982990_00554 [Photorhabdus luminescens]